MTTVKPKSDRVLIKSMGQEQKTAAGILIPEAAQQRSVFAKVIAVGPGKWLDEADRRLEPEVKVDDVVVLVRWGMNVIQIDEEEYCLIREEEILAVVDGDVTDEDVSLFRVGAG